MTLYGPRNVDDKKSDRSKHLKCGVGNGCKNINRMNKRTE